MRLTKARKACVTAMMKDTIYEAVRSLVEQHGASGLTMDGSRGRWGWRQELCTTTSTTKKTCCISFICGWWSRIIGRSRALPPRPCRCPKLRRVLHAVLEQAVKYKEIRKLVVEMDYYSELRKNQWSRVSCRCSRRFSTRSRERARFARTIRCIPVGCSGGPCGNCSISSLAGHRTRRSTGSPAR